MRRDDGNVRKRERERGEREGEAGVKCRGTHFYDRTLGGDVLQ